MLSKSLYYDNYSDFVNICINDYRNETYIRQQQELDNSFTTEQATTPKHTYFALSTAIKQALKLEKFLQELGNFGENKLIMLNRYLSSRGIFDSVMADQSQINQLVSQQEIAEFERQDKI